MCLILLTGLLLGFVAGEPVHAASNAYDQATADNPDFGNKEVWPMLTGKERFLDQKWPEGRVYVWAHPGLSTRARNSTRDPWDPKNWLVDGKPPEEVRFDENTDMVLPDSDTPYVMDFYYGAKDWQPLYRHVTVGRNVQLRHHSPVIYGNLWIKQGGKHIGPGMNKFTGGNHTFLREDNGTWEDPRSGDIGQYFGLNKNDADTSMEIIGGISVLDRVPIERGMLIIGPDSRFSQGRNATMVVGEDATVVLMDNARLTKWVNQIGQVDLTLFGTLLGGTPERPLNRPAFLGLSYQNTTGVRFFDRLQAPGDVRAIERRISPLMVAEGATLKSHSATPEGRIHIGWSGIDAKEWHLQGDAGYRMWIQSLSPEDLAYLEQQFDAIPKKIVALFQKNVQLDGVVFNDFHRGGILLEDVSLLDRWSHISLGTGNEAEGRHLLTEVSRNNLRDGLKSSGGEYTIGEPVEIVSKQTDVNEKWETIRMSFEIPAEAAGKRLKVFFQDTRKGGNSGWSQFRNFSCKFNDREWIQYGDLSEVMSVEDFLAQSPNPRTGSRAISLKNIAFWELEGAHGRLDLDEESRSYFITAYNSAFGQISKERLTGGEKGSISFEARARPGNEERSANKGHVGISIYYMVE